jgi:hypothetical protein
MFYSNHCLELKVEKRLQAELFLILSFSHLFLYAIKKYLQLSFIGQFVFSPALIFVKLKNYHAVKAGRHL